VPGRVKLGDRDLERMRALSLAVAMADDEPVLTFGLLAGKRKFSILLLYHLGPGERPLAGVLTCVHAISLTSP
jgi:hypothetical protein